MLFRRKEEPVMENYSTPPFPWGTAVPQISQSAVTATVNEVQATVTVPASTRNPPASSPLSTPAPSPSIGLGSHNLWESINFGARAGVIICIVVAIFAVLLFSLWFCCGCCGGRICGRKRRRRDTEAGPGTRAMPLNTIHNRIPDDTTTAQDAPPPRYEETVPPEHRTVAGGITHVREEEEGIVADGKTPLSEIPFEDVVLDHSQSEGSARNFDLRHHGSGGDTTGHTNS